MKVMDVLKRIKGGEKVVVSLPGPNGTKKKYSLTDGTDVSEDQFISVREFLVPSDPGLLPDADPQSFTWGG